MKNKTLLSSLLILVAIHFLQAQNFNQIQLTKCAELAKDSAVFFDAQSASARKSLEKLLGKMKYDRATYFGSEDRYFIKGMAVTYWENKNLFSLDGQSDKNVTAFLDAFKDLYHADKNLAKWEYLQSFFEKEAAKPKSSLPTNAMMERGALPSAFSEKLKFDHLTNWTQQKLMAYALASYKGPGGVQYGPKVESKNDLIKLEKEYQTNIPYTENENFSPDWIAASYPMDGQYNFYFKEWKRGIGYFLFNRLPHQLLSKEDHTLMVRWTDNEGSMILSEAVLESFENRIDFAIPSSLLKKERLYRLELLSMKQINGKPVILATGAQSDADYFSKNFPELDASQLATEQVLHTIYFRTSKWDSFFEKAKTINFEMDEASFTGVATLDEPLDNWELFGRGKLPASIQFRSFQDRPDYSSCIGTGELVYYLTFPEMEPIDVNDLTTTLNFEAKAEKENEQWRKRNNEKMIKKPIVWVMGSTRGEKPVRRKEGEMKVDLENGYSIYFLPDPLPISLKQDVETGFITKEHFEKGQAPVFSGSKLTIHLLGPEMIAEAASLTKAEIARRKQERAAFFHLAHVRDKKKNGETETRSVEDFSLLDNNYMDGAVKRLYDQEDLSPRIVPGQSLITQNYMPGTKFRSTELKIDLKKE